MYPYELEKGSKKHTCPQCGSKKTFRRVIEVATGHHLPDYVGRCDRESKCGYQYTWTQYLADNPDVQNVHRMSIFSRNKVATFCNEKRRIRKPALSSENGSQSISDARLSDKRADYLETRHLLDTLKDYEQNGFVQFLKKLFPYDLDSDAVKDYLIGTKDGFTVFPTISKTMKVCKAKLMKFDSVTGKRLKDADGKGVISSLQAKLKKAGKLDQDFETDKDVFFGEHLLRKYSDLPIAIVESEKTAVIASICKGAFPCDFVWLATGSKQWLKGDRIKRLGRDRKIILYPDADGFGHWQQIASDARKLGISVKVSNLIETLATSDQKAKQVDLADYLISEQQKRNDPALREAFRDMIEERLAVMTIDGRMSEEEAETYLEASGVVQEMIRLATSGKANE